METKKKKNVLVELRLALYNHFFVCTWLFCLASLVAVLLKSNGLSIYLSFTTTRLYFELITANICSSTKEGNELATIKKGRSPEDQKWNDNFFLRCLINILSFKIDILGNNNDLCLPQQLSKPVYYSKYLRFIRHPMLRFLRITIGLAEKIDRIQNNEKSKNFYDPLFMSYRL